MTPVAALLLGLLQGLTELLPVSSSGHLALAERFWHLGIPGTLNGFDILLHLGSLLALLLCLPAVWWRLLRSLFMLERKGLHLLLALIVATIPGALAGLFLKNFLESADSLLWLAAGFLINAALLLVAERRPARQRPDLPGLATGTSPVSWGHAIVIGCAQAFGLFPSVSRSACTIAAARFCDWTKESAVDFSFLLAVPIIAGAEVVAFKDVWAGQAAFPPFLVSVTGVVASFCASVFAIFFLRGLVRRVSLAWFALYLIPLGVLLLFLS